MQILIFFVILTFLLSIILSIPKGNQFSKIKGFELQNALNPNQFKIEQQVGNLDMSLTPEPSVMNVQYDPSALEDSLLVPGEAVMLWDLGAGDSKGIIPIIAKRDVDTDIIYGIKIRKAKTNKANPGDYCEIARRGGIVWMKTTGALARGVRVATSITTPGAVYAATTEYSLGVTLDHAENTGDLVRVEIDPQAPPA